MLCLRLPRRRNDFSYSPFQGASETSEPGISRFRVWSFGPSRNDAACRMTSMKTPFTGLAVAAVLVIAPALPGYAEDAAAPRGDPRAHHCSNARVCSTRGAAAKRAASVAGAENRGACVTACRSGACSTSSAALRPSLSAIWHLSGRLLGAVSDLLAALLPQPDPLEPDTLVQLLTRASSRSLLRDRNPAIPLKSSSGKSSAN
jgi:hypothetical protein